MASPLSEKILYVKDRCVNAFWMLRNGKFKLIVKSLFIEADHRVMKLKTLMLHGRNPDYSNLPGSTYVQRRKITPPSYCPTHPARSSDPQISIDKTRLANELEALRSTINLKEPGQL